MASYADAVRIAHAPVAPTVSEVSRGRAAAAREDGKIEPELVAAVSNSGKFARFHPTVAVPGEKLPNGFSRSCAGFLLDNQLFEVEVNQEIVKRDTEFYQKHAVVAYFVGGKLSSEAIALWIKNLQTVVGDWVGLGRDLGRGFFQVLSKQPAVTQKLLMLTPHRSRWGTCILQTWTPGFNAAKPEGLKIPTWVTLKDVPDEFLGVAEQIAGGLGELLGVDRRNLGSMDQRFCLGLSSGAGWKTQVVVQNAVTGKREVIMIDYCNLPIRCRFCLATDHLVKDCTGVPNRAKEAAPGVKEQINGVNGDNTRCGQMHSSDPTSNTTAGEQRSTRPRQESER